MRWYDYMMSDLSEQMQCWGPKSAGLFDEKDAVRTFKDQDLVDNMVYGKDNDAGLKYNLSNGKNTTGDILAPTNGFMMTFMTANHSKYHPCVTYTHEITAADMDTYFNMSFLEPRKTTLVKHDFNIWSFGDSIPDLSKANQTGKPWNDEMTKLFTAKSGDKFDKMYADWLKYVDSCGYTDDLLAQINARDVQDQNYNGVNYLDNLK